jgi:hypothetical protein
MATALTPTGEDSVADLGPLGIWTFQLDPQPMTRAQEAVAWLQAHLDAGADHVWVQVQTSDPRGLPAAEWRELASIIPSLRPRPAT